MHDCQRTSARLVDLVYNEAADADALRTEVKNCPACRTELRALTETLRAFDRVSARRQPGEDEWAGYQARLAARLLHETHGSSSHAARAQLSSAGRTSAAAANLSNAAATSRPSMSTRPAAWPRRALTATWRVPAPAAVAAIALLIVCLTLLALRPARLAEAAAAAAQASANTPLRIVEIPVVQEKIVTRTVYVTRRAGSRVKREARSLPGELARGANKRSPMTTDTLIGFRPAEDVKLRVIKGNYANEK